MSFLLCKRKSKVVVASVTSLEIKNVISSRIVTGVVVSLTRETSLHPSTVTSCCLSTSIAFTVAHNAFCRYSAGSGLWTVRSVLTGLCS